MSSHRTFLFWLLYIVCVVSGIAILLTCGVPQLAVRYDHSYLTVVLFGLFAAAEVASARQAWRISQETLVADTTADWLNQHAVTSVELDSQRLTLFNFPNQRYDVPSSVVEYYMRVLFTKAAAGQKDISQDVILHMTADRLYDHLPAEFLSARIVWIGILATILGVIMAFWPMIDGASLDLMKANLGGFFGGIAVAFIPTAVSFALKITLDCNTRIITVGIRNLIDKIAVLSELHVLPFLATNTNGAVRIRR
jgi:hypothetical protein